MKSCFDFLHAAVKSTHFIRTDDTFNPRFPTLFMVHLRLSAEANTSRTVDLSYAEMKSILHLIDRGPHALRTAHSKAGIGHSSSLVRYKPDTFDRVALPPCHPALFPPYVLPASLTLFLPTDAYTSNVSSVHLHQVTPSSRITSALLQSSPGVHSFECFFLFPSALSRFSALRRSFFAAFRASLSFTPPVLIFGTCLASFP